MERLNNHIVDGADKYYNSNGKNHWSRISSPVLFLLQTSAALQPNDDYSKFISLQGLDNHLRSRFE